MYYIADNNSFRKMILLNKVSDSKNSYIANRFWLSIKSDAISMIRRDENFIRIPTGMVNDAIDEVSQEAILAVYKGKDSFINNPDSKCSASRINWLKSICHNKLCDYLNHNQQIFNSTLSIEQDTIREIPLTDVIEDTNTPIITEYDIYFFTRFYVFFTDFNYRIKSKIMFFYKEIIMERDKRGKNGGISGKHNCLTEISGKTLFELGNKAIENLKNFVAFDIPENYLTDIIVSITMDLSEIKKGRYIGDEIFDMKYSHAASENSRIKKEFSVCDDKIKVLANKFYDEFEKTESLMSR